jgi:tRNA-2-methylthio-N6-dimethylallyladenosine synthase
VVPYTRGEEVSRPFDDVIAEVAHLAAQGVREVTLLGQNVNGYRGTFHDGGICSFAELLRHVAEIPGIGRIRYTTSHPLEFGDDLIAAYADIPQLVSHVHLPVQSGSDNVLAAMKRNHTVADYRQRIQKLMAVRPDMHISSDFIIGFPGETDADFEATLNLIAEIGYDHSYSFIYSKRPGTPAAELPDPTPEADKKQRLHLLKERIRQQTQRKTEAMLGKRERLLVERVSDRHPGHLIGIAGNTRWVHFPGDTGLIGKFVDVDILEVSSINSLLGSAPLFIED